MNKTLSSIQKACTQNQVIVAVTKKRSLAEIKLLYDEGIRDFGENKAQELLNKISLPQDIRWHFIGHLQSNKIKSILPYVALIHSVDTHSIAYKINEEALKLGRVIPILLEINVAKDPNKYGFDIEEVENAINDLSACEGIEVRGIMVMGPHSEEVDKIESCFKEAHLLFKYLQKTNSKIQICSMGMSQDYLIALQNGTTCIRIGSALFTD